MNKIKEAISTGIVKELEYQIQRDIGQNTWIKINGSSIRDKNGKYQGTLEVSQDITNIKKLEGERRLLDWN